MAYKTTITFKEQSISPAESIQLILEFAHDAVGSDRNWNAEDYNLRVLSYGERQAEYKMDDAFLVFGSTTLTIGDPDQVLDSLMFGSDALALATSKQFKVTKKINGVSQFIGNAIEDTISYSLSSLILTFSAAPRTDAIQRRMIFNDSGLPLNPFDYTEATQPLSIFVSIKQILLDIYQLVNPDLTLSDIDFDHDWSFWGQDEPTGLVDYFDFTIDELEIDIWPLFFDPTYGINTAADILKRLAIEFAAFTGITSNNKPFFRKLFAYDAGNIQTVKIDDHEKGFEYGKIFYVKVVSTEAILPGTYNYYAAEAPNADAFTEFQDEYIKVDTLSIAGLFAGPYPATNLRATRSAVTYAILGASDPDLHYDGTSIVWFNYPGHFDFIPTNWLLADFWYLKRGNIENCRVDNFVFRGVLYDFIKNFNDNGSKYQIIKIVNKDASGVTECKAIYLGEL